MEFALEPIFVNASPVMKNTQMAHVYQNVIKDVVMVTVPDQILVHVTKGILKEVLRMNVFQTAEIIVLTGNVPNQTLANALKVFHIRNIRIRY